MIYNDEFFNNVAAKLREIYPKGRKPDTPYMWRDSVAIIAKKLKTIYLKYDFEFTEEQAIKATENYVKSFNGNYTYMQLLKYFILKTVYKNGESDVRSDFMALIENEGEEEVIDNDWSTQLR